MAAMDAFFAGRRDVPLRAVHHQARAVALVNERLGTPDAVGDASLTAVGFLVVQHLVRGERALAGVHFAGLRKMVELRGGLGKVAPNEVLAVKLCKCVWYLPVHRRPRETRKV